MEKTLDTLILSEKELAKIRKFVTNPDSKYSGTGKIEVRDLVLIFELGENDQYDGYFAKKGETTFKRIKSCQVVGKNNDYVCFNGGLYNNEFVVRKQDLGEAYYSIIGKYSEDPRYNRKSVMQSITYTLIEKNAEKSKASEKAPAKPAVKKPDAVKAVEKPKEAAKVVEKKPAEEKKAEPKKADTKKAEPKKETPKKEEPKKVVKPAEQKKVEPKKEEKPAAKEQPKPIKKDTKPVEKKDAKPAEKKETKPEAKEQPKPAAKKAPEKVEKQNIIATPEKKDEKTSKKEENKGGDMKTETNQKDEQLQLSSGRPVKGKQKFLDYFKNKVIVPDIDEEIKVGNISLRRGDNSKAYTPKEEGKILDQAKNAVNGLLSNKDVTKEQKVWLEESKQDLIDFTVGKIKEKFPIITKDYSFLKDQITRRVQNGARMSFTMSDDEKKDIDKVLDKATEEQIKEIAYGKEFAERLQAFAEEKMPEYIDKAKAELKEYEDSEEYKKLLSSSKKEDKDKAIKTHMAKEQFISVARANLEASDEYKEFKSALDEEKQSRRIDYARIAAREELAKAGAAIQINGSPELQSVIRNVGIVDNKETGTAHVSINELKNLDGVYYKLGVVPAYASALVDFVSKKYNSNISEEEKAKLTDLAHELVLREVLNKNDVDDIVEAAAVAEAFRSPIVRFSNIINGHTTNKGEYVPGIIDQVAAYDTYEDRVVEATMLANEFVNVNRKAIAESLGKADFTDKELKEETKNWRKYFLTVAQTRKHVDTAVGKVVDSLALTEDQQNAMIGFVNKYKNVKDVVDLKFTKLSPIENKVVIEKLEHVLEVAKVKEKLDEFRAGQTYKDMIENLREMPFEDRARAYQMDIDKIVAAATKGAKTVVDEDVNDLKSYVDGLIKEDAFDKDELRALHVIENIAPEYTDSEEIVMNPVYDRVDDQLTEVAQIPSDAVDGYVGAIYVVDGVAYGDDGEKSIPLGQWDAETKTIIPSPEKTGTEKVGIVEDTEEETKTPVEEVVPEKKPEDTEKAGVVEEVVPEEVVDETPGETNPEDAITPENVEEVVPEKKPEDTDKAGVVEEPKTKEPEKDAPVEDETKPGASTPDPTPNKSDVIISDPIKINGGKRGNYQGVLVIGPHPEVSNTTERGLYFVDLEKLRAAGRTLDDLKNNFDAEELFGEKGKPRYGFAVRRVQVGHDKNGVNYFRLDYYYDKKHHGVGSGTFGSNKRFTFGKKPRIQSYAKSEAKKAENFLKANNMLEKTQEKHFTAGKVVRWVGLGLASAGALAAIVLPSTRHVLGNNGAQANAAVEYGLAQGDMKIETIASEEKPLFVCAENQILGMGTMHEILSDKPQFKARTGAFVAGQFNNYSSDTARGFGESLGKKAAEELKKAGITMQDEKNNIIVYYPTSPSDPQFKDREASKEYLNVLGYTDAEADAFLNAYENSYNAQYQRDLAKDGPQTGGTAQPPIDEDAVTKAVQAVQKVLGTENFTEIFSTDGYVFVNNEDTIARIKLGDGANLAEKINHATDIIKAGAAEEYFRSAGCEAGLGTYLNKKYDNEGGKDRCTMYVTQPVSEHKNYTPLSIVVVKDDAGRIVKVVEQKLDTVTLADGVVQDDAEIVVAATLASDRTYRYSQAKGVSVKKTTDQPIPHNGQEILRTEPAAVAEKGRSM